MIKLFFILGMSILSCGPTKTTSSTEQPDSASVAVKGEVKDNEVTPEKPASIPDGSTKTLEKPVNSTDNTPNSTTDIAAIPACIQKKIDSFKLAPKHEQPQRVVEYTYRAKKVYYVVMPCCDFFNEVYDAKCNYLGAPDGGFTGKGDGKLPEFLAEATKARVIWTASK